MFWDRISPLYDLFENVYNRKVYAEIGARVAALVAPSDAVLECACGTGAISVCLAPKCRRLVATDFSAAMLRRAAGKCRKYASVSFEIADITHLPYADGSFDVAVAGNVIHLLAEPEAAVQELARVVRPGGKLIIPTYLHPRDRGAVKFLAALGAHFERGFDLASYRAFFAAIGYDGAAFSVVDGRMPCAIAVIAKP